MKGKIVLSYPEVFEEKSPLNLKIMEGKKIMMTQDDLECLILGPLESRKIEDPFTPHHTRDFIVDLSDKEKPKLVKNGLTLRAMTKGQAKLELR